MKIALITPSISRLGAGVASAVKGLSKLLRDLDHDVHVLSFVDAHFEDDLAGWGDTKIDTLQLFGPRSVGYSPSVQNTLSKLAPDIIHLHGLWTYVFRSAAGWAVKTNTPYIISPHGMLAPSALNFSAQRKQIARVLYQNYGFDNAAAVHATSDQERQDILTAGITRPVSIIPHGIDLVELPSAMCRKKTVLSMGRLHPVKGLDVLVEAWARVEQKFPDWTLEIVGPDEAGYAAQLKEMVRANRLERVSIEGAIYGEDKYRLLSEVAFFVLPSRSENFALTVLESLMFGTPAIASEGTPWRSLKVLGCGDWVPGEPGAFAAALERMILLSDTERRRMGEIGARLVRESYSWQSVGKLWNQTYEEVLQVE
ncbi:MAG: glycosyltransferase [Pseudomonadota bacterium]